VDFTTSPSGSAPPRLDHVSKGKGKDKVGEPSRQEVPNVPSSTTPEDLPPTSEKQVVDLVSPGDEETTDIPMDTSTWDVITTATTEVPK
ncbi:hypothetical protein KI387_028256, partial [Taxus chinensis]